MNNRDPLLLVIHTVFSPTTFLHCLCSLLRDLWWGSTQIILQRPWLIKIPSTILLQDLRPLHSLFPMPGAFISLIAPWLISFHHICLCSNAIPRKRQSLTILSKIIQSPLYPVALFIFPFITYLTHVCHVSICLLPTSSLHLRVQRMLYLKRIYVELWSVLLV